MFTSGWTLPKSWLFRSIALTGMLCCVAPDARSQEAGADAPPAASAVADQPAAASPTAEAPASAPAVETPPASPAANAPSTAAPIEPPSTATQQLEEDATATSDGATALPATAPATTAPAADAGTPAGIESAMPAGKTEPSIASEVLGEKAEEEIAESGGWGTLAIGLGLLALFIVPILIGNYLARVWRMPDHAWKFSLCLGLMAASIVVCFFGQFKFGPDLAGGITLVYELADAETTTAAQNEPGTPADEQVRSGEREFRFNDLIGAIKKRLDPDSTKEITVRKYGPDVEIIIPQTGEDEMEFVKRKITDMGQLEFRITADESMPGDKSRIDQAKLLPPSQKILKDSKGDKIAEWVSYDVNEFGPVDAPGRIVKRQAGDTPEALVLKDAMDVTGEYLKSATKGLDEVGGPAVHFAFNHEGARRFGQLTSQNLPNAATRNERRQLGIVLDKRLISAPEIRSRISDSGQISGGTMTDQEVDHIINILKSGSLPLALNKQPISQWTISPTLGAETIEQGKVAILASLAAVVLFMLAYYRFAGFVACLALTFNLLLVLALMVLIRAAFTLPGLAGLVLTIGMSVDANVLIYERIREELRSGAALRMAIRNGFSRAMNAIIDSNVTTIISGVALYYIGTDQVKGFAVTLILGILTSMFTAIFFARVVFDVAERRGWIKELRMAKLISTPNFDFLRVRWLAGGLSLALIAVGMFAAWSRGPRMLDIDFTGGSSVTFTLTPDGKMNIGEIRDALNKTELAEKNLVIVELGISNRRYTVDSSDSVDHVKEIIAQQFGDRLMKYKLEAKDFKPYKEGDFNGTEATLVVNSGGGYTDRDGMSHDAMQEFLQSALKQAGVEGVRPVLTNPNYLAGSGARFKEWNMQLVGIEPAAAEQMLQQLSSNLNATPLFPMANNIGGRVSGDMQTRAILAIIVSLIGVIAYLWIRFQNVTYGLAAGAALVHDVLVTIGAMAISAYIVQAVPGLASVLQLEAFQINLTIVAALLTIIGYSLNDTIVTFDRLREIKGKSPRLTPEMVNASVNQTLSRTILTATTVFIVVVILYFFGGEGIHSFAFAFLIGVIAGTYSTVFIAAPVLLWLEQMWERYFSGSKSPLPAKSQASRLSEAAR